MLIGVAKGRKEEKGDQSRRGYKGKKRLLVEGNKRDGEAEKRRQSECGAFRMMWERHFDVCSSGPEDAACSQ